MGSDPDPIANDRRKQHQLAKLPPDAACVLCGKSTPEALLRVKRTVLDRHHPLTEAIAPKAVVPLCRNCHAEQTEMLRDLAVDHRRTERTLPEKLVAVLRSLGGFFATLGQALLGWADQLSGFVGALDLKFPVWRQMPEAQS